jgi:hypothetical protein
LDSSVPAQLLPALCLLPLDLRTSGIHVLQLAVTQTFKATKAFLMQRMCVMLAGMPSYQLKLPRASRTRRGVTKLRRNAHQLEKELQMAQRRPSLK